MQTRSIAGFQTEVEFTLPKGYLDPNGVLHRKGVMRLATAADEIQPHGDPRVQQNPAYLAIIVLARVVIRLGEVSHIDTRVIESLFASDLDYLQRLYERINGADDAESIANAARSTSSAGMASGAARLDGFATVGEA